MALGDSVVHSSMSPKGVEHEGITKAATLGGRVHSSMSPKGVEHSIWGSIKNGIKSAFINVAERR